MTIPQQIHSGKLPAAIIARTENYIAFLDHEPITAGHALVCPVRQVASLFDLSQQERLDFLDFAEGVELAIRKTLNPIGISQLMNDGPFNELDHLHLHLVPRYRGDGFTWITPDCRKHTMPELEEVAKKLRSAEDTRPPP